MSSYTPRSQPYLNVSPSYQGIQDSYPLLSSIPPCSSVPMARNNMYHVEEKRGDWMKILDRNTEKMYYANSTLYEKCWDEPLNWKDLPLQIFSMCHLIPPPPSSKYKNIDSWLVTRKLLNDLNDEYVNNDDKCIENMIALTFGSWKELIYHLINTVNEKQRNVIQQILKQQKIKYDDDTNDNDDKENNLSYFDRLSVTSITNICGYLDINDIKNFKLTSNSIAVQCLLEMKKFGNVGVLNMSELLENDYNYKYLSLFSWINTKNMFRFRRYNKSIINDPSLYLESWSNEYNIPTQNLFLLHSNHPQISPNFAQCGIEYFSIINDIKNIEYLGNRSQDKILIFNSEKLNKITEIVIDGMEIESIDAPELMRGFIADSSCEDLLILLYYFDIKQQYVEYNQTLIVNKNVRDKQLSIYIENNIDIFINKISNSKDKEEFVNILNRNKGILSIQLFWKSIFSESTSIIIFSLNDTRYIEECRNHCQYFLEETFYDNPWYLAKDIIHRFKIKKQLNITNNIREAKILSVLQAPMLQNIFSFLSLNDMRIFSLISVSTAIISSNQMRKLNGFKYKWQSSVSIGQEQSVSVLSFNLSQTSTPRLECNPLSVSMLENAKPVERKRMIGERLWPKVCVIEPRLPGKITGMLLELDNDEIMRILSDQTELMKTINEVLAVLKLT